MSQVPAGRRAAEPDHARRIGRGVFLATMVGGLSSLLWGKAAWSRLSGVVSPVAGQVAPFLPTTGWRIYTISGSMPGFDPETWRLEVGGLVESPASLSYDELLELRRADQVSTFHCVTGWTVENVHWGGVRLNDLFARVRPLPEAQALEFVSAETPYADYLTLHQSRLRDVMLAYEMDGKPLSRAHGAPLRLVIPEMYGYKNVKWLARINLVAHAGSGYWEQLGYDRDAWVGRSNGYSA